MGIPHITSFCWCMGLEIGTKLIGFLHLGVSITLMTLASMYAQSARGYIGTMADEDRVYSSFYKLAVIAAVMAALHVLLAINLLIATYKRNTVGVRVWVYMMCLLFCTSVLYVLIQTILTGLSHSGSDIFLAFLQGLVFYGLLAYCILCVNSYYLMLKSSEDMEGPHKTNY